MKQQFNVNLPPALIHRVKHRAIDAQLSLSTLVQQILETSLALPEPLMPDTPPDRRDAPLRLALQPMVHVEEMAAAIQFYEQLGGTLTDGSRDGDWALIEIAGAQISLLAHPPNPDQNEGIVELNFQAHEPLEHLEQQLRTANVTITQPTTDEGFGRQLQISSPDGLPIKINELQPNTYR